ncbi:hypothetical protein CDAR_319291 [Caerostris darwini]|uniref:Uncharacterized protein n=1 Tax=Caerostris darwini TaxID=1538125 RepID=A0AAV4TWI9_9ARAC|nr:hypothetical protein CDAR_319291 [Caerostris darwini]
MDIFCGLNVEYQNRFREIYLIQSLSQSLSFLRLFLTPMKIIVATQFGVQKYDAVLKPALLFQQSTSTFDKAIQNSLLSINFFVDAKSHRRVLPSGKSY